MSSSQELADDRRAVFISYSSRDNTLPSDSGPKARGFVDCLYEQLVYELQTYGLEREELWFDKRIMAAEDFMEVLADELAKSDILLAVLSNGYVASDYCKKEISHFGERLKQLPGPEGRRRIFRIDKNRVPNYKLPPLLANVQAIRFYEDNSATGGFREYFWRGKFERKKQYRAGAAPIGMGDLRAAPGVAGQPRRGAGDAGRRTQQFPGCA